MTWSTISGENFRIIVKAYRADGSFANNYNGSVTISVNNGAGGKYVLGSFAVSSGQVTISPLVLTIVYGHSPSRTLYADDDSCNIHGHIDIAVWFNVKCTQEGLVGGTTACGHVITPNDHFVALPSTGMCGVSVRLRAGSTNATTTVQDVGPWFPYHINRPGCTNYPNDNYWNTTGVPLAQTLQGQQRSCDPNHYTINGAGIDLADGTFSDLGSPSNVLWRFN